MGALVKAEVEAVNIKLDDDSLSYVVPTDKVLLIEHLIWGLDSDATLQRVTLGISYASHQLKYDLNALDIYSFQRPFRLVGGNSVSILKTPAADWRNVAVVGLLVDQQDLYAAKLDTNLENVRVAGGKFQADARFASPRPRIVKVEKSADLENNETDPTAEVAETTSPANAVVSVDANEQKKFMKVTATTREAE
jgi:hypothetical protein